jgi:hypothetical protein
MDKLKWSLGYKNGVAVDCLGKSGGLALWWRDDVEVSVRPWCNLFIDAKISFEGKCWRFSGIYGEPRPEQRHRTWEALRFLKGQDDLPWLCVGDFNEVTSPCEQIGGNARSESQMLAFRECLSDCELNDLGFKGYKFTWNNKREGQDNIQVRLDRGTAAAPFLNLYPETQIEHIITEESDHMALLVRLENIGNKVNRRLQRGFAFEEMWTKHENYEDMIVFAWENSGTEAQGINGLWTKLHNMSA